VIEPLEGAVSAADAALLVAGDERPFALVGDRAGSQAVVGSQPLRLADFFEAWDELRCVGGGGVGEGDSVGLALDSASSHGLLRHRGLFRCRAPFGVL
jgi:hypothetical protein